MPPPQQARFEPGELAVVLSHYDLGVIESVTDFLRGSRRSPKVGVVSEKGKFLLKRRSLSWASPERLRFSHYVQTHLVQSGFPVPRLIPTRDRGWELLQIRDQVYELFEFVPGQPYRKSREEARDAGAVLARFHRSTVGMQFPVTLVVPRGDYHDAPGVRNGLHAIGSTIASHESLAGNEAALAAVTASLLESYDRASQVVGSADFQSLDEQIVHADWHPGNVLYKNRAVIAVIDYDASRISRRIVDIANGILQFSMISGGDPSSWPDHLDEGRFKAFLAGYEATDRLTALERTCIPSLMIEALISECVPPITRTGSVGKWSGYRVLQMARRKVAWIERYAAQLLNDHGGQGPRDQ